MHLGGQVIGTTAEHPFYVKNKGWVPARALAVGDELGGHDGKYVAVEEVFDTGAYETVYNVRVSEYHTYFVGEVDWSWSAWAHNANYANADPAVFDEGNRFTQPAVGLRNDLPVSHRNGVTIAVTELDGVEIVSLYANKGRRGDQVPLRVINEFKNRVKQNRGVFHHAQGEIHAEELIRLKHPEAQAIGISHPDGPCEACDEFFQNQNFFNVFWPD